MDPEVLVELYENALLGGFTLVFAVIFCALGEAESGLDLWAEVCGQRLSLNHTG